MKFISVFYMKGDEEHRQMMFLDIANQPIDGVVWKAQQDGFIQGWDTQDKNHKYIVIPWEKVVRIEVRT